MYSLLEKRATALYYYIIKEMSNMYTLIYVMKNTFQNIQTTNQQRINW